MVLLMTALLQGSGEPPPLPALPLDGLPAALRERVVAAERRVRQEPTSAQAAGELGLLLHAHDQQEFALVAYERARALDPAAFEWGYLAGLLRLRTGRPAEAVPPLRAAFAQRADSLAAGLRLGEALLAAGDAEAAAKLHGELQGRHPEAPQAYYGRGRAEAALGRPQAAAASYEKALQLFPAYGAAHYALGLGYRDLGRPDDAQRHLRLYQQHLMQAPPLADPELARVQRLRQDPANVLAAAVALGEAGDSAGSIREHLKALELDPGLTKAHANLMALYGQAEAWDQVEQHYRAAVEQAPGLVEAHFNYALALQQQKRQAEAEASLRRVLELSPHHAPAQNALGALLELDGRLADAAAQYRLAAENQADFRAARFNLGRVLVELGRPSEAVPQFAGLVSTESEETPLHLYALAVAEARAGDPGRALPHAEEAERKAEARGQRQLAELARGFAAELRRSPGGTPR
jgi:tetratricopeptide (TPR) repeat protein